MICFQIQYNTKIPCECSKVYTGVTGMCMHEQIKEHNRDIRLSQTQTLGISEHANKTRHYQLRDKVTLWRNWPIRSITRVYYHQLAWYNYSLWLWRWLPHRLQNVSHCQQQHSYSGLRSPGRLNSTYFWNDSWVQTFHKVQFIDRDPHWYSRRVKEAIHVRLHPNNINRDSGIEIPEATI